jgi:hypothetical protein
VSLPPALAPLAAYPRFVTYRLSPHPDKPGKTIKQPTDWRTGHVCDAHNEANQTDYATALATGRPVGFVIDARDGFWFLDIDACLVNGAWSPLANELATELAGAAIEVSQSGTGLHLIGRGAVPGHACKNIILGLELYTEKRFVALTGTAAAGDVMADKSEAIARIAARYFPPNMHGEVAGWSDEPIEGYGGPEDDADLLRVAMSSGQRNAAAAFGGQHVTFADLWTANVEKLAARWPDSDKGPYDASSADAALAGHLAFWTGKNCERIRALMLQSALVRGKWEDRPEYLETTIMRACAVVSNVAKGRDPIAPPAAASSPTATTIADRQAGREFLPPAEQRAFFEGCVYVIDAHKVWIPSTGDMLDKARFDIVYGGHIFVVDNQNEKTTDSAFDAFTRSRVYSPPTVFSTCFRPEEPPGAIIVDGNRTMVNTYVPIETRRLAGDAGPFTRHLEKMLPNPHDREVLLHYMASMLQNPGRKFQWWPVVQGTEGNGKTLLDRIMSHGTGSRYSHLVNPEAMAKTGNQFNAWVQGNLYLGVEEIHVGDNRRNFLESFKATVTNDRVPIERKGVDQGTGDNRINGMLFSNWKNAVPVTVDTRRYAIFFTAQQNAADLERDGMTGGYFPDLYDWFYGRNAYAAFGPMYGAAIVNDFLRRYPLQAALDPAQLCVRAPKTSSTDVAYRASLGRAEQEIIEAIGEGRPGFCGGWISSLAVDKLLDNIRAHVPRSGRRDMLKSLGYDYHPGLPEGRVNNVVAPDNGRPRLYVTMGHLSCNLTEPAAIAKAYSAANDGTSAAAAARFK